MEHLFPFTSDLLKAIANGYTEDFHFLSDGTLTDVRNNGALIPDYIIDCVVNLLDMKSTLFHISTCTGLRGTAIMYWDQL
jgi:hypothetical protein